MKFFLPSVALAALAAASPTGSDGCKPATYRCDHHTQTGQPGWDVCNTSGQWVFAGYCPPKTICKFDRQNGSPYCVPPGFQIP
ncbi:uncharacterized protein UV8b_07631 [Ustilaginoidea virens]|uniref:Uncharacterized protein n=1 Tax=Ustilaginoidea virens TaxID=1159556 RepID=A0A8E5HXE3_USTVR|nr:uncharacterized protein UV8b_07631 [Ustilaginoidea virens]QUC23390.1 hypothetical protein UV8b_07631 [Ustilaginoidea virens]